MNVYITSEASVKLWTYIESVKTEIGGWGFARIEGPDTVVWYDTFLVPQIVSGSEVDFDTTGGDVAAVERAIEKGVLDMDDHLWVSWHSHHTMGSFFSNTDDTRITKLALTGIKSLLSFVGCHDHKYSMRLDYFGVQHGGLAVNQVTQKDLKLMGDPFDDVYAGIAQEIADNVTERPAATSPVYTPMSVTKIDSKGGKVREWRGTSYEKPPGGKWQRKPEPKQLPEQADTTTVSVDAAFAIRELMDHGVDYEQAKQVVSENMSEEVIDLLDRGLSYVDAMETVTRWDDNGFMVGPDGLTGPGYDSMAWEAGS